MHFLMISGYDFGWVQYETIAGRAPPSPCWGRWSAYNCRCEWWCRVVRWIPLRPWPLELPPLWAVTTLSPPWRMSDSNTAHHPNVSKTLGMALSIYISNLHLMLNKLSFVAAKRNLIITFTSMCVVIPYFNSRLSSIRLDFWGRWACQYVCQYGPLLSIQTRISCIDPSSLNIPWCGYE